jgi:hypothetical protein
VCLLLFSVSSCSPRRGTIVVTPNTKREAIADTLAALLHEVRGFELRLIEGEGSVRNLDLLRRGEADLTIVENSVPFQRGIRTVVPLYPSVLHILHKKDESPQNFRELVLGKTLYVGARGGLSEWIVELIRRNADIPSEAFTVVDDVENSPDVVIVFAMLDPAFADEIADGYEFYSIDRVEDLGRGATVDGLSILFPHMKPFVIPRRFYGEGNPDPVITVSVDNFLVARADIPDVEIYDLTKTILEHKQELATVSRVVASAVTGNFDENALTFPLHPGTRKYLDRNEPGLLERYAELAGVSFAVFLASASGFLALAKWRKRRKKDRIDVYYVSVIEGRASGLRAESPPEVDAVVAKIRKLQDEAFGLLIDERLTADESFQIFVTLAQDAVEELRQHRDALVRGKS